MKKEYVSLNIKKHNYSKIEELLYLITGAIKSFFILFFYTLKNKIGIKFWHASIKLGFVCRKKISKSELYSFLFQPMDSFRYFEFDFLEKYLPSQIESYLDVSSPRLFTLSAILNKDINQCVFLNPDKNDIEFTKKLVGNSLNQTKIDYKNTIINKTVTEKASVDVCTLISVLEHIPDGEDEIAIESVWEFLKPGGVLLLSVPCAKIPFDEYINFNEYNILTADNNGFVFGQRFYNEEELRKRIYSKIGEPLEKKIFGEKINKYWIAQRDKKFNMKYHPFWLEAVKIYRNYQYFNSIEDMPGMGVIGMVFRK